MKACIRSCIFSCCKISRESLRLTYCELTSHGSSTSVAVYSPDPGPVPVSISTSCSDLVLLLGPNPVSFRPWSYPHLSSWSRSLTDPIAVSGSISYTHNENEDEWQSVNCPSCDFGWFYSRHLHWSCNLTCELFMYSAATSRNLTDTSGEILAIY